MKQAGLLITWDNHVYEYLRRFSARKPRIGCEHGGNYVQKSAIISIVLNYNYWANFIRIALWFPADSDRAPMYSAHRY